MSFQEALEETQNTKRHLLLGNGFSISLFPDRFRYGSLLEQVNFSEMNQAREVFDVLATADFEVVIAALNRSAAILPLYSNDGAATQRLAEHAAALKEHLVRAIASRHPERPSEISEEQYDSCRQFLAYFVGASRLTKVNGKKKDLRGCIYTFNYDLLLYWTLLHDQILARVGKGILDIIVKPTEELEHDDGFRAPPDDYDAAYVTWDAEGTASDKQNIHYLHGGLHLFDRGSELQKCCWERGGGVALIDQIRSALDEDRFPLFVSEGSTQQKLSRIRHSGYLQRSLRSFSANCRVSTSVLFIFGHSLAENDDHALDRIAKGKCPAIYVSIYGDENDPFNRAIIQRAQHLANLRRDDAPLTVTFFRANTAKVWG